MEIDETEHPGNRDDRESNGLQTHPVMGRLVTLFGDHTFYVDTGGLFVWEGAENGARCDESLVVAVKLASWADEALSSLAPHEPQLTAVLVELARPS